MSNVQPIAATDNVGDDRLSVLGGVVEQVCDGGSLTKGSKSSKAKLVFETVQVLSLTSFKSTTPLWSC